MTIAILGRTAPAAARTALTALADAGLLVQPGGKVREEWVAEVYRGDGYQLSPHPDTPYITTREVDIDQYVRGIIKPKRKLRRTVHAGPWRGVAGG